jgi:LemA protein
MNSRPRWLVPVVVVVAILLVIVLPVVSSRNRLVDKDTAVDQAFGDLDVQLQRRIDLIPNLVATAKQAQIQEQKVYGDLAAARQNYAGAGSQDERVQAGQQAESALGRLLAIVEAYPQLNSNQNLRDLANELSGTENRLAQARRQYNEAVTDYNRSVRRFPATLVAGIFGFDTRPLFTATAGANEVPQVDFGGSTTTTGG